MTPHERALYARVAALEYLVEFLFLDRFVETSNREMTPSKLAATVATTIHDWLNESDAPKKTPIDISAEEHALRLLERIAARLARPATDRL